MSYTCGRSNEQCTFCILQCAIANTSADNQGQEVLIYKSGTCSLIMIVNDTAVLTLCSRDEQKLINLASFLDLKPSILPSFLPISDLKWWKLSWSLIKFDR